MVKGYVFKYSAESDSIMKDKLGTAKACGRGLRDPDFWSNDCPVWAVCGPYCRQSLDRGDVIFFAPKKGAIKRAKLADFVCTGILVVDRKIDNSESVLLDTQLTEDYKKRYCKDLAAHLKKDKKRSKIIRSRNFVVGDSQKSVWLGKNNCYLCDLADELEIQSIKGKLSLRRIPALNDQEVRVLYKTLTSKALQR